MASAPDWNMEEFELVLNNSNLPSTELVQQLPRRSTGAIEVVRAGIHGFHTGANTSMLSELMLRRLEMRREQFTCAICGQRY